MHYLAVVLHRSMDFGESAMTDETDDSNVNFADAAAHAAIEFGEAAAAPAQQLTGPATAGFQQARARAGNGMETVMKTAEDMIAFGQGNVEALVKSGQIWAAGVQDLSKQLAATVQANLDETMGSFKAFSGVKSVKDAIDLQATFARTAMEKAMAETGRMTDASLKLAEQAMAPITARVTLAVETMVKPA